MSEYTFSNLNPYKNTIYKDFYDRLFKELGKQYYTALGFPEHCRMIYQKAIYMPWEFIDLLGTRAMQASAFKIQTAHSYKLSNRMEDTRYEHMCFAYILGVDLLLILEKNGYQIDAKTKTAFLIKLLLHDNGHGPFSHPFEEMVDGYKGMHEDIGNRNLKEDKKLRNYLEKLSFGLTDYIIDFKKLEPYGLHELVEGIFDLDRAAFLIIDSWLSNSNLYKENSYQNIDKLIASIYNIFEHIILKDGHVYFHPDCFLDIKSFLEKRAYNYIHLYNDPTRLFDDMILHEYGVVLLHQKKLPSPFHETLIPVLEFQEFLKEMKEKQANIDLDTYFHYVDQDLHTIAHLSQLFDDPELTHLARSFLAASSRMMVPYQVEEVNKETYEQSKKSNSDLIATNVKITVYKSTEEEHIIFLDPKTNQKTDYKDMGASIDPIEKYYLYHKKTPRKLKYEKELRTIFTDYFYTHALDTLFLCEFGQSKDKEPLNKMKYVWIIDLLKHIVKNKPFEEYAKKRQISMNQLFTILSFFSYDPMWNDFANFASMNSDELGICFREIEFETSAQLETFQKELLKLLEGNHSLEDIPNPSTTKLYEKLCICSNYVAFIDEAVLESIEISPETKKAIETLFQTSIGYQKKIG